jgi:hypothetical protein
VPRAHGRWHCGATRKVPASYTGIRMMRCLNCARTTRHWIIQPDPPRAEDQWHAEVEIGTATAAVLMESTLDAVWQAAFSAGQAGHGAYTDAVQASFTLAHDDVRAKVWAVGAAHGVERRR